MTTTEQKRAAKAFVAKWSGKGYEKGVGEDLTPMVV